MKHEREIMKRWRLKRTLSRRVEFRPIEADDLKYAWAAYKRGALKDMAGPFADTSMTAEEFDVQFQAIVPARYHGAWTLIANTPKRGVIPVGMVFGFWSHADLAMSPFMIVGDIAWFPWASPRNRIESAVYFFQTIRSTYPMVDYAYGETNRRFFEMICQHGAMRRVGTTFNVVKGEPCAIFETRAV